MLQPLIIVCPWYGPHTTGGAETQARQLARSLRELGLPVQVWSSTGRDAAAPQELAHYPAGWGELDGVPVRRFAPTPADERGVPRFFARHPQLLPDLTPFAAHELRLLGSLIGSDGLYEAILEQREARFIFVLYAFPTTFWGALLAPERAWLLPCLHDEPYARYSTMRHLFRSVRGVLANSHGEAALARRLYDLPPERVHVAGEGIELHWRGDGAAFRARWGLDGGHGGAGGRRGPALLLYVGRRDGSKNLPLLLAYAREYWARRGRDIRLLLAGPPAANGVYLPQQLGELLLDLGFLSEQEKHDAYAAADLLIQPSLLESFSIVLMEAWLQRTPALVHSGCDVTRDHCARSGGGLTFGTFGEFAAALDLLLPRPALRQALGERGHAYVLQTCRWEEVARRTAEIVVSD
jgi:glycosyltransferase involved in cell wall biosynthesis